MASLIIEIKQVRLQKNKDGSVRAFIDVDNKEGLKVYYSSSIHQDGNDEFF